MNNANDLNMYGKLLGQVLFQGMSRSDMEQIVAHTKFGFHKRGDGEHIVKEGTLCEQIIMLTDGDIEAHSAAADKGYLFVEMIRAPYTLQPERLFGLTPRHSSTFRARGKCHLLTISKEEVIKLISNYFVFQLNILNTLSTMSQKANRDRWGALPQSLRQRIVRFMTSHCLRPAGEKLVHIKMKRLADELNETRLNVSKELNRMQDENLIALSRGRIYIPALEKLLVEKSV